MLLALLFALIFGPGGESEFISTIPNLKKEIKINIPEKARRDSLLMLVNEYESSIKSYQKTTDKMLKDVNQVSTDRSVMSDEFLQYYDAFYQSRIALINSLIDYRLMFQQQITDKELMLVIEEAIVTSADMRREKEKLQEQTEDKLNDAFAEILDIIDRNIVDPGKSETVTRSFFEFERTMYDNVDRSRDLDAERQSMLLNANPTRDELRAMYEKSNRLRYQAARDFAILREKVIQNTTPKEWDQINKELKAFFKS